jgi:hypothetical protein
MLRLLLSFATLLSKRPLLSPISLSLAVVLLLLLGCFVSSLRFSTRLVSLCTWYIFDPASVDCMHFNCLILSYLERLLRKAEPLERVIFFWAGWLEFWGVRSLLSFWRLRFGLSGFRHEREKEKNLLVLCVEGSSTSSSARILFFGEWKWNSSKPHLQPDVSGASNWLSSAFLASSR